VAKELAQTKGRGCKNVFVHFYLPNMRVGEGAFAVMNRRGDEAMRVEMQRVFLLDYPEYKQLGE
jgi:hypothetical protein